MERIEIYGVMGNKFSHPPTAKRTLIIEDAKKVKIKDHRGQAQDRYIIKLIEYHSKRLLDFIDIVQRASGSTTNEITIHFIQSDKWIQSRIISHDEKSHEFYFDVFKEGGRIHGSIKEV